MSPSDGAGRRDRSLPRRRAGARSSGRSSRYRRMRVPSGRSTGCRPARSSRRGTRRRRRATGSSRTRGDESRGVSAGRAGFRARRTPRLGRAPRNYAASSSSSRRAARSASASHSRVSARSMGRAMKKPWPRSQPRSRSAWYWPDSSMPSATTSSLRLSPSATIAAARPSACGLAFEREERPVHLEDVDRESAEVAERRIARCRSRPSRSGRRAP